MDADERAVEMRISEPHAVPRLSLLFGYGAMMPPVAAAVAVWLLPAGPALLIFTDLSVVYGGALLAFFAGVRRGVSFRTPGGPTGRQIATMLWLFTLGGAALALLVLPARWMSLALIAAGHASLALLDPPAARKGEAPLFFARLRPPQMSIAVAAYLAILARVLLSGSA